MSGDNLICLSWLLIKLLFPGYLPTQLESRRFYALMRQGLENSTNWYLFQFCTTKRLKINSSWKCHRISQDKFFPFTTLKQCKLQIRLLLLKIAFWPSNYFPVSFPLWVFESTSQITFCLKALNFRVQLKPKFPILKRTKWDGPVYFLFSAFFAINKCNLMEIKIVLLHFWNLHHFFKNVQQGSNLSRFSFWRNFHVLWTWRFPTCLR